MKLQLIDFDDDCFIIKKYDDYDDTEEDFEFNIIKFNKNISLRKFLNIILKRLNFP